MTGEEAVLAVIDALEALSVPYMVVGALSVNCYTAPRSTQDADFVIELADRSIADVCDKLGPEFDLDPQISFETVTGTQRYVLTVTGTRFKIELFLLRDRPHDQQRFGRRRPVDIAGRRTFVPTAEDVIITKLRWSQQGRRSKDMIDVENVIRSQRAALDWPYIKTWCDRHGTRDLLEQARQTVRDRGIEID